MTTTTIRVALQTRDRLNALARRRGIPAGQLIDELVRDADEQGLLDAAADSWKRLVDDSQGFSTYRAESRELERFDGDVPGS